VELRHQVQLEQLLPPVQLWSTLLVLAPVSQWSLQEQQLMQLEQPLLLGQQERLWSTLPVLVLVPLSLQEQQLLLVRVWSTPLELVLVPL